MISKSCAAALRKMSERAVDGASLHKGTLGALRARGLVETDPSRSYFSQGFNHGPPAWRRPGRVIFWRLTAKGRAILASL